MEEVSFTWRGHGKAIMVMILSLLEAIAPIPEQDPEPPQELAPTPTVLPAAASEPKLAEPSLLLELSN